MSPGHPTLEELRAVVQKERHRVIGNWLARRIARPSAVYGTWAAIRLGLSAHQVTVGSLAASLAGALAIGWGTRSSFVLGTVLLHLGFWLDHVDGQVARWRRTVSLNGVYLDYLMHHLVNLSLGFALGCGLANQSGNLLWAVAGFAIAVGWALLALHNDCRYKAFFQRLKSATGGYRIDGGAGGRPAPPPRWPRRGIGMMSWPAQKLCEPHVVLVCVTALAVLAVVNSRLWVDCWQAGVGTMALLAPVLAGARIARAVARGTPEAEFDKWFRPDAD